MKNKMLLNAGLAFAASVGLSSQALAAGDGNSAIPSVSEQAEFTMFMMEEVLGQQNYSILDRPTASLHLVRNGEVYYSMNIILGAGYGDREPVSSNATRSGITRMRPIQANSSLYGQWVVEFGEDSRTGDRDVIHPVIDVRGQDRLNWINSPVLSLRRASDGCLNIPIEAMPEITNFSLNLTASDGYFPFMAVTPENPDLEATAQFFGVSPQTVADFREARLEEISDEVVANITSSEERLENSLTPPTLN